MTWDQFKKSYETDILISVKKNWPEIKNNSMHIDWDKMTFIVEGIPDGFINETKLIVECVNSHLALIKKPN